jgi:hypothetical protein
MPPEQLEAGRPENHFNNNNNNNSNKKREFELFGSLKRS